MRTLYVISWNKNLRCKCYKNSCIKFKSISWGGGEINIWSLFKSYCWSNHWIHKERNLTMTKHGWPWEWNINLWREYKVDPTLFNTLGYNPSQRKFIAPIRCNRSYRRYSIHIEEIYMTMSHRIRSNPVRIHSCPLYITGSLVKVHV